MQLKHADATYSDINEPLLNPKDTVIQLRKETVIYIKSHVHSKKEVTGIIQPSSDLLDNDDLISCPALTTTQNRQFT